MTSRVFLQSVQTRKTFNLAAYSSVFRINALTFFSKVPLTDQTLPTNMKKLNMFIAYAANEDKVL